MADRGTLRFRQGIPFPQRRDCRRLYWSLEWMDDHFALEGAGVLQAAVISGHFGCAGYVYFTSESRHQALPFKCLPRANADISDCP